MKILVFSTAEFCQFWSVLTAEFCRFWSEFRPQNYASSSPSRLQNFANSGHLLSLNLAQPQSIFMGWLCCCFIEFRNTEMSKFSFRFRIGKWGGFGVLDFRFGISRQNLRQISEDCLLRRGGQISTADSREATPGSELLVLIVCA